MSARKAQPISSTFMAATFMTATFTKAGVVSIAVWWLLLSTLIVSLAPEKVPAQVPAQVQVLADTPAVQPAKNSNSGQPPTTAGVTSDRVTVEERLSRDTAKAKGDITFDDIKFELEKGGKFSRSLLTKDIEALDKKAVRIRGYILPASVFKQSGIEEFVLVRDNMQCCFGPGAALYDCIMIQMEPGKTADFTTRPVAVRGKFEIKEFTYPDSDEHYAIYKMTASEAK